jgi:hypothetical protein
MLDKQTDSRIASENVFVCVCVCVRERERDLNNRIEKILKGEKKAKREEGKERDGQKEINKDELEREARR